MGQNASYASEARIILGKGVVFTNFQSPGRELCGLLGIQTLSGCAFPARNARAIRRRYP